MPPRNWRLRIEDILESIAKIRRYTNRMDFQAFTANEAIVDAVVRNLEIIGEAARHIPNDVIAESPLIPWRQILGMRNMVVHEYFGISLQIIWETVQHDLDPLVLPLQELLKADSER